MKRTQFLSPNDVMSLLGTGGSVAAPHVSAINADAFWVTSVLCLPEIHALLAKRECAVEVRELLKHVQVREVPVRAALHYQRLRHKHRAAAPPLSESELWVEAHRICIEEEVNAPND